MLTRFRHLLFTGLLLSALAGCGTPPANGPVAVDSQKPQPTPVASSQPPATATPVATTPTPGGKPSPAANTDFLIQPGYQIGKIALGQARPQVHALLGRPVVSYSVNDVVIDTWGSNEADNFVEVSYRNNQVAQVEISSPKFATADGVSTKNTLAEIQRAYPKLNKTATRPGGEGEESETTYFEDQVAGVSFSFLKDKCFTVAVHKPGTAAVRPQSTAP